MKTLDMGAEILDLFHRTHLLGDKELNGLFNKISFAVALGVSDPAEMSLLKEAVMARKAVMSLELHGDAEPLAEYIAALVEATCDEKTQAAFFGDGP